MNRGIAEKLMGELLKCHKVLDDIEFLAREIEDESSRTALRKAIIFSSSTLYTEAMGRIISRFPDLEPFPVSKKVE